jgi:hypothetical protein
MKFTMFQFNSNLFKAISWLLFGMSALFIVVQTLVASINLVVEYIFRHKSSKVRTSKN